jgi:hypothetical protein
VVGRFVKPCYKPFNKLMGKQFQAYVFCYGMEICFQIF